VCVCVYLLGEGRELEHVERLVKARRVPVDVDHHGDAAATTEEELQEVGELGLPEGHVVLDPAETQQTVRPPPRGPQGDSGPARTGSGAYLACWFSLKALMHFPSVSSELLMLPASFSRSPVFRVREQRSDPARSHRDSLTRPETRLLPLRPGRHHDVITRSSRHHEIITTSSRRHHKIITTSSRDHHDVITRSSRRHHEIITSSRDHHNVITTSS